MAATTVHHSAGALKQYDSACRALAAASSTDEVLKIRNQAIALKAYARQAKNWDLERDAIAVRKRAERRAGELIAEQRKTVGLAKGSERGGRKRKIDGLRHNPTNIRATLAEAGIDKNLADRARKAAALPADDFEAEIEEIRRPKNIHFSSEHPEHYTPQDLLAVVIECLGAIDLDPCSNSKTKPNVEAKQHFTRDDDGLTQRWQGRVYMNPPYGREIDDWIQKLLAEYTSGRVTEAIALLPSRTDTRWFQRLRDFVCCFISGRLVFGGNTDPAPFPSVLFYLGDDIGKFYHHVHGIGDVWQRIAPELFAE
jgi:DNA N-6-adenine-methyltransferase (Dam)